MSASPRRASLTLAGSLALGSLLFTPSARALPNAEAEHACALDPRSSECTAACRSDPSELACEDACEQSEGVEFCPELCLKNTDLNCLPSYRAVASSSEREPIFQSKWRIGARGVTGAQIRERPAAYLGAELSAGLRMSPLVSLLTTVHIATGVDDRPWPIASVGASLGAEFLFYDAFGNNTALAVDPEAGLWLPNACFEDRCPLALPMMTLGLRPMIFKTAVAPDQEGFQAFTFGLEGGVGYDPFLGIALGRAGLSFGVDLGF